MTILLYKVSTYIWSLFRPGTAAIGIRAIIFTSTLGAGPGRGILPYKGNIAGIGAAKYRIIWLSLTQWGFAN
jgi:hypothetical protein